MLLFGVKICPKFETDNFSQKFSAEIEFRKIDPWTRLPRSTWGIDFWWGRRRCCCLRCRWDTTCRQSRRWRTGWSNGLLPHHSWDPGTFRANAWYRYRVRNKNETFVTCYAYCPANTEEKNYFNKINSKFPLRSFIKNYSGAWVAPLCMGPYVHMWKKITSGRYNSATIKQMRD
jgi:hypothetical protein